MKKITLFILLPLVWSMTHAQQAKEIEGRWDLTIDRDGRKFPSWLEVVHSGNRTLVGYFVGISGSARPISKINVEGAKFNFAIPPQWETGDQDLKMEGGFSAGSISGNVTFPDGKTYAFTGEKAPLLKAAENIRWGKPVKLLNGNDLTGWTALGRTNQWVVANGVLSSPRSGANIRTEKTFKDFKLHIEFRYPKGSNSGVYLRGRYEVQVSDNAGAEPTKGDYGAVYGFLMPNEMAAKPAGEWQTMDITLVGRKVTVVANGKTIIADQLIPGPTGGALDSKEGEPGPILLQGDHGAVEYRNITIAEAN